MYISKASKLIFFYYIFILIWWAVFYFLDIHKTVDSYLYQFAFGLIPLIGGILGLGKSKIWGGLKSEVGTSLFFISLGCISWGIGQMFWSILYNFILKVDIPYPSFADLGYILAVPLWAIGIIHLSRASGARASLKNIKGKILLFIIPLILVALSYYLIIAVARGGAISSSEEMSKTFFDFTYPIGDVIILTLSLLIYGLSFGYLGGKLKIAILSIIFGFVAMYISDFSFSYTTTIGTYYNGYYPDILFPTALMLMVFGVNNFVIKEDKS